MSFVLSSHLLFEYTEGQIGKEYFNKILLQMSTSDISKYLESYEAGCDFTKFLLANSELLSEYNETYIK